MTLRKVQTSTVTIQYVQESRTRSTWGHPLGLRRFVIGAERQPAGDTLAETRLSFSTLDPWKASLCDQAWKHGFALVVKHRKTAFFDDELLCVEKVQQEQFETNVPDGDPERDREAQAALEQYQNSDHRRDR